MKFPISNFQFLNSSQGVSLYLAIMVMAILLVLALGISTILVSQMKTIRGMGDSVIAFCAADTGIEKVMYEIRENGYLPDVIDEKPCGVKFACPTLNPDTSYIIIIKDFTKSGSTLISAKIDSRGRYKETYRAIEIEY